MPEGRADLRLIVIRHGETDWNVQQRFQGHVDPPLNGQGFSQARRLGERLGSELVDQLICSDLLRTRQTAAPLAEAWGLTPQPLNAWREQHFGELEGMEVTWVKQARPEIWATWLQQDGDYALPGGGESMRLFHKRVMGALDDLVQRFAGQTVAVVTHGGVLDMLWRTAHAEPLSGLRRCAIPNCGVNRLRQRDDRLHVEVWADEAHLPATTAGQLPT
jgi:2,3-bisphosphoglycerate-dependent phosphoglycerate mutase